MARSIEVRYLEGLIEHIDATILTDPHQRTVRPDKPLEDRIGEEALRWLRENAADRSHVSFAVYKWPSTGPAFYAILWAYNPRTDRTMRCAYSETAHEHDLTASWDEAEMQLNMFALKQFGRPTEV